VTRFLSRSLVSHSYGQKLYPTWNSFECASLYIFRASHREWERELVFPYVLCTHFPSCYFNQQQLREFFEKNIFIYSWLASLTLHTWKRIRYAHFADSYCSIVVCLCCVERNTKNKYKTERKTIFLLFCWAKERKREERRKRDRERGAMASSRSCNNSRFFLHIAFRSSFECISLSLFLTMVHFVTFDSSCFRCGIEPCKELLRFIITKRILHC
jgi:hypothetical protein